MTRTAPELAAFLGITPRQLAGVLRTTLVGPQYSTSNANYCLMTGERALEIANAMDESELREAVATTRLTHPEYFA
ncbi:MAG: hypothetical protein LC131_06515 [Anaerolineae bacterium]|nr:hypothetical protein [Anaerolineae bacterium]